MISVRKQDKTTYLLVMFLLVLSLLSPADESTAKGQITLHRCIKARGSS